MLALLPILLSLAPSLITALAGDKAGTVATQAVAIAKTITGTETPEAAAAALAADPAKATELGVALAKITADARTAQEAEETARLKASLADVADARAASGANPLIARAQVCLAAAIVLMFAGTVAYILVNGMPDDNSIFALLFGALIAAQQAVISFFFGNSTSAHSANNAMASLAQRMPSSVNPSPTVVNSTGPINTVGTDILNDESLRRARER